MAKTTHKHRALKMLESLGWEVDDVERILRNGRLTRRFDLFGFADLLCVKGPATLAVQVCSIRPSGSDLQSHQAKMLAERRLARALEAGWLVELWGVRNVPKKNGEAVTIRSFELSDDGRSIVVYEGSEVLVPVERSV